MKIVSGLLPALFPAEKKEVESKFYTPNVVIIC